MNDNFKDKKDLDVQNTPKEKILDFSYTVIGVILIFIIIGIISYISKLTGPSPEEQQRAENNKQALLNNIKHCESVVNSSHIDFNNSEFQRCNKLLQDSYSNFKPEQ